MYNYGTSTISATTTQQTNTGTVLVTTDPTKPMCHELSGYMMRNTQRGQADFGAWFKQNVAFADDPSVCVGIVCVVCIVCIVLYGM
jgi:hypothetical protein